MANRMYRDRHLALEPEVVHLYGRFTHVSADTATKTRAKGMTSLTYTSAGLYVLTLQDTYKAILAFNAAMIKTTAPVAFLPWTIKSETISSGGKTITLNFWKLDNAATPAPALGDPATDEISLIDLILTNSSAL